MRRMLNEREACAYIGLGATKARQWLRAIGARVSFGRSIRYDVKIIDEALDSLRKAGGACE